MQDIDDVDDIEDFNEQKEDIGYREIDKKHEFQYKNFIESDLDIIDEEESRYKGTNWLSKLKNYCLYLKKVWKEHMH